MWIAIALSIVAVIFSVAATILGLFSFGAVLGLKREMNKEGLDWQKLVKRYGAEQGSHQNKHTYLQ